MRIDSDGQRDALNDCVFVTSVIHNNEMLREAAAKSLGEYRDVEVRVRALEASR
jgi:hypothetical protein